MGFCSTNMAQFTQIRKSMIEMVLATDMKLHFDILGRFRLIEKKLADLSASQNHDSQTTSSAATKLEPEALSLCMQVALKCVDFAKLSSSLSSKASVLPFPRSTQSLIS